MSHCDVTSEQEDAAGAGYELLDMDAYSVDIVASDGVKSHHPTTDKMMSTVSVEGQSAVFQLDTGASSCIMSQELFDRLRRNSRRKLHVKQEKMSVRLADGSISKKPCKNVWLSVKSHQLARPQRLNFIVMSGSQNLLGRWAMYKLWPRQFSAFKEAICASLQPRSVLVPEKKEAISDLQPRSALVPGKKSDARQSATSVGG